MIELLFITIYFITVVSFIVIRYIQLKIEINRKIMNDFIHKQFKYAKLEMDCEASIRYCDVASKYSSILSKALWGM